MSEVKLKNAPLKEVIFELHWAGNSDTPGVDDGFDLAQGKFAEKLKLDFPLHRKLIPDGTPFKIYGMPIHQYWKAEFQWPVVQHGHGIMAVNEVESGYEWERTYKPNVIGAIKKLIDSYEDPIKFNKAKLQYVDVWDVEVENIKTFIEENLRTTIQSNYPLPGSFKTLNLFQVFDLEDGSEMQLSITNGVNNQSQKSSVIWTTTIEKRYNFNQEEIVDWLEKAHTAASDIFKKMLNSDFYASLDE